jgi:hypothetical protein
MTGAEYTGFRLTRATRGAAERSVLFAIDQRVEGDQAQPVAVDRIMEIARR